MRNGWELYDRLIAPVPADVIVEEILSGSCQTMVKAGGSVGIAATNPQQSLDRMAGMETMKARISWYEAASLIKSWNFTEASIGAAALNAYYNRKAFLEGEVRRNPQIQWRPGGDAFAAPRQNLEGSKVATIGHFHYADPYVKQAGACYILEREPVNGDYPDSACEYILPDMDYVYITGFTLVNKTLPRLLELSRNATVILVGPSVPMAPVLFEFGVDELAGTLLPDQQEAERIVRFGSHRALVHTGEAVRLGTDRKKIE